MSFDKNNRSRIASWVPQPFQVKRESSWSRDGFNRDFRSISPNKELELANIRSSGVVTRLWFAVDNHGGAMTLANDACKDPLFLRKTVLQIFWEDSDFPSVNVPLGDFFGVGHGKVSNYSSALLEMTVNPADKGNFRGSFISWIQMPFKQAARFVIRNDSEEFIRVFWHIDYQKWYSLPSDAYYFHSNWRCEQPCKAVPLLPSGKEGANLTGENNYVVLDTTGEGTFFGCNLSVDNCAGGWWGEGDDMVFIDGESFPGSLHGTGQEEYFGQAWGMQNIQYPYFGTSLFNSSHKDWEGKWTMYRFHVVDPIPFLESIKVTFEHGHNNHRSDDYSSTAYWYQRTLTAALELPSVEDRIPRN